MGLDEAEAVTTLSYIAMSISAVFVFAKTWNRRKGLTIGTNFKLVYECPPIIESDIMPMCSSFCTKWMILLGTL